MRKRRIWFAILTLAAVGALIWMFLHSQSDPVYEGKPLRHWLALYTSTNSGAISQADDAVRHIGTNAIPTLLDMMQENDSPLKLKWIALLGKQHFIQPPQPAFLHNMQAVHAFHILGATASNAVPALVQIYRMKISRFSQQQTLEALSLIGPAASPAATPVLLDALTNSNGRFGIAVTAIYRIRGQPEVIVPALVNVLKDFGVSREKVVLVLAEYGSDAKPAVPALVDLYKNDPSVRGEAAYALEKIDPQAAAKAGVK